MVISMSKKKNKKHRSNYLYYENMSKPANSADINKIAFQVFGSLYYTQDDKDDILLA